MSLNLPEVKEIIRRALDEDIGSGDITTSLTVPPESVCRAKIVAKEEGVIAGLDVAALVFAQVAERYSDKEPVFRSEVADGAPVRPGDVAAEITGSTAVILTGERTALNFLQRMSGIATKTAGLVELVKHTVAKVTDTRKTTPGLRILEKYAVRVGGGRNHRFGLYDAVLIKDNHIRAAGSITEAVRAAKSGAPHGIKIEVEADTIEQVKLALDAGAEMILLDNMDLATLRQAVALCKGKAVTEGSGGVTEQNIAAIAETGVDLISVGALTHSAKALDLSLEIV
ncbi:MAG TPA: carboxylating nicotinate-nucleotide diphosphorylase [Armatimonadota bacterium]|nr:carboxylating nicotinate-nucleotide diphosphorylase [Armatimonadota bacterium]